MKNTETEWKAAAIFRIWNAVQERLGFPSPVSNYAKLTIFHKTPFRAVATGRTLAPIEAAWDKQMSRRASAFKSPYKASGLHPARATGRGGRR